MIFILSHMLNTFLAVIKDSKIELINLVNLPEGTKLLVTPLPNNLDFDPAQEWVNISLSGLSQAYNENEPEYSLESIKELNPEYEGK